MKHAGNPPDVTTDPVNNAGRGGDAARRALDGDELIIASRGARHVVATSAVH